MKSSLLIFLISLILLIFVVSGCDLPSTNQSILITVNRFENIDHWDVLSLKKFSADIYVEGLEQGKISLESDQGEVIFTDVDIKNGKNTINDIYTRSSASSLLMTVTDHKNNSTANTTIKLQPAVSSLTSGNHYFSGLFIPFKKDVVYVADTTGPGTTTLWKYFDINYFRGQPVQDCVDFLNYKINQNQTSVFVVVSAQQNFLNWQQYQSLLNVLEKGQPEFLNNKKISFYQDIITDTFFNSQRQQCSLIHNVEITSLDRFEILGVEKYRIKVNVDERVDYLRLEVAEEPFRDGENFELLIGGSHLTIPVNNGIVIRDLDMGINLEKIKIQALTENGKKIGEQRIFSLCVKVPYLSNNVEP